MMMFCFRRLSTRQLWDLLLGLVGITWFMSHSVFALVESWRGFIGARESREAWGAAPTCLFWCILRERNQCTFEGVELSVPNLKFSFLKMLYDWYSNSAI